MTKLERLREEMEITQAWEWVKDEIISEINYCMSTDENGNKVPPEKDSYYYYRYQCWSELLKIVQEKLQ